MTTLGLRLNKVLEWSTAISISAFVLCGLGEWIVWDWLRDVPCASNAKIEWKGFSKCVTAVGATLWRSLDYGTYAGFVGVLLSALLFKASGWRKT